MNPWSRFAGRLKRDASRLLARRMVRIAPNRPLVSFTFDDFPKSALYAGGRILREHGVLGTYYASFGLIGRMAPTGQIFALEDLNEFRAQGHELGCHTFDHYHSWNTSPMEFEASILRNRRAAAEVLGGKPMCSFSYPISGPRPVTKRRISRYFNSARGGGQTFNRGWTDLRLLRAFFLEQSRGRFEEIQRLVDANAAAQGWLVFATHDVCDAPTQFGCTPEFFQMVLNYVQKSGAAVLSVSKALEEAMSPVCAAWETGNDRLGASIHFNLPNSSGK